MNIIARECGYSDMTEFHYQLMIAKGIKPELPKSQSVFEMHPSEIKIDAGMFQFKRLAGKDGNVGSLTGVKVFDPNLAGILLCWRDPSNGSIYVVNGHNRLILARKLNQPLVALKLLQAGTAKEARFIGGLANIAEKSCDVYDVAKFFRDNSLSDKELADRGICLKGAIVKDALSIIKLNNLLFDKFLSGEIPPDAAVAIGDAGLSDSQQNAIWDAIKQLHESGKDLNKSLIEDFIASVTVTEAYYHVDIFGNVSQVNCAYEYAKLLNKIVKSISKNVKLFGTVAKHKELLAEGNNSVDEETSSQISKENQSILDWLKREAKFVGPVAQYLNKQALRCASDKRVVLDEVIGSLYDMYKRSPAIA